MRRAVNFVRSIPSALRRAGVRWLAVGPLFAGIYLGFAQSASARCCTLPSGGSPNANSIASLYNIIFVLSIIVFLVVMGFVVYSVWAFRASKNPVALQIHGNTKVELGLTLTALLILVIIATVTFIKLPSIVNPPASDASASSVLSASLTAPSPPHGGQKLTICVTGRQFIWRYTYGASCTKAAWQDRLPYSYQEMVVPAGEVVDLVIQSSDVVHSWWVPALGGKVDAVPGFTTYAWFKALHANELYRGNCAQLCGRQHAYMTALVKVVTPQQYKAWITQQSALINDQNNMVGQVRQQLIQQGILTPSGNF